LIKKRIIDGQFFKETSNLYVAKYVGRSLDVRWDYENILKLAMYYNAEVNIEYTKIGIVNYFKQHKQSHRLMRRPQVAMPKDTSEIDEVARMYGLEKNHLIGTPATTVVIAHQDGKVKEYIDDYYDQIYFPDVLEQLREYRSNDRRKYDLVIAMGLCELADEELMGIVAQPTDTVTQEFSLYGYYIDPETGYKKFGVLPKQHGNEAVDNLIKEPYTPTWIDASGGLRFDENFEVTGLEHK
jgi:hypothetical protein